LAKPKDKQFAQYASAGGDAWAYPGPLSDDVVAALISPAAGNRIKYDTAVKGFGARVTATGAKSFVLNYRNGRRDRRITIGSAPDWPADRAREQATTWKRQIDIGADPMGERHTQRAAPTVNDLADRFVDEYLPYKRPGTQDHYRRLLRLHIRPELGKLTVAELRHADVEALHRKIAADAPTAANRAVAVLSKMLSLAVKWELRGDNCVKGVERMPETKRERYLTPAEIARLFDVLAAHRERSSANAITFLLLTGARRGEVLGATWDQFDLAAGVWTKPAATTKQAKIHRVPLSAPALALLAGMKEQAKPGQRFLFPGAEGKPLQEIKRLWASACRKAGLAEKVEKRDRAGKVVKTAKGEPVMIWQPTARIHDLRHTFASVLAGRGLSLPVIGSLLGHTQAATTNRYAHLMGDPLRAATEAAAEFITNAGSGTNDSSAPSAGRRRPAIRAGKIR